LYFLPLPQWQGSLRPTLAITWSKTLELEGGFVVFNSAG